MTTSNNTRHSHGTQTQSDHGIGATMAAAAIEQQLVSRGVPAQDAQQAARSVYFYIATGLGAFAAVVAATMAITGGW